MIFICRLVFDAYLIVNAAKISMELLCSLQYYI